MTPATPMPVASPPPFPESPRPLSTAPPLSPASSSESSTRRARTSPEPSSASRSSSGSSSTATASLTSSRAISSPRAAWRTRRSSCSTIADVPPIRSSRDYKRTQRRGRYWGASRRSSSVTRRSSTSKLTSSSARTDATRYVPLMQVMLQRLFTISYDESISRSIGRLWRRGHFLRQEEEEAGD